VEGARFRFPPQKRDKKFYTLSMHRLSYSRCEGNPSEALFPIIAEAGSNVRLRNSLLTVDPPTEFLCKHMVALEPLEALLYLHSGPDAVVHFLRKRTELDPSSYTDRGGRRVKLSTLKTLGAVPASELRDRWADMVPQLGADSYFSINSTSLYPFSRKSEDIRWLNAIKLDFDWHDRNLTFDGMLTAFVRMLGEVQLPEPNLLVRSGRGLWARWKITENSDRRSLYRRVNDAAVQAFDAHKPDGCIVDPSVSDAARIMRVPGSINTSSENVVVEFYRCSTANYTLVELANLLAVKPEKTRLIPGECSAAKRKAGRARWSNPLQSFFQLWRKRGNFSVGTRHGALFVFCYLARRNGWRESRIREYAEKLVSNCDPVLTVLDIEECLASSRKACAKPWSKSLRNQTICNMLNITTEEERRVFIKPLRKSNAMVLRERRDAVERRRRMIIQELLWAGSNVSGRAMTKLLVEKHGLRVSHATVAADLASTTVRSATVQFGCASTTVSQNTQQKLTGQPKPPVGSSEASGQSNIPKNGITDGIKRVRQAVLKHCEKSEQSDTLTG
jgi:hypothetical protein